MASAPGRAQRMPDILRRCPMTALQPDSTTPEPTNRPRERNQLVAHPRRVVQEVAEFLLDLVFFVPARGYWRTAVSMPSMSP